MSRENLHSLKPRIIALSVAMLLLSAVGVFGGLPDHASSPADTAHAQGEGRVDLDHQVYLPAVMKALDTTPPVVISVGGASLSYEVDGQTIQRAIVVQDLGETHLFDATGDEGDIPYGITSTLTIAGIRTNVDLTDVLVEDQQGIEAQVTDACGPGENPCDISVSLNPTYQPEYPIDASVPYSFSIGLVAYGGKTQLGGVEGETFNPFTLEDLGYPENPDELAQILASDQRIGFVVKDTYKTDDSCGGPETHHMGTELEVFTYFEEGDPDHIPAPTVTIYSPAKGIVVHIHAGSDIGYVINTLVGRGPDTEKRFFSYIHVHSLEDRIQQELADAAGVDPSELDVDYDDPNSKLRFDFEEPNRPIIQAGRVVGYLDAWTWNPGWGIHHALMLHANYTWGVPTDNLEPVQNALPELSPHYINWILQELVVDRDLTIGLGNEGNNRCTDPTRILDYINDSIKEQLIIEPDPYKDHYFWVHKR